MVEHIDKLLKLKNIKRETLADACGFSTANISRWKNLGSLPNAEILFKMAEYLNTDMYFLLIGKEKSGLDDVHKELVELYDGASEGARQSALDLLRASYEREKKEDSSKQNTAGA